MRKDKSNKKVIITGIITLAVIIVAFVASDLLGGKVSSIQSDPVFLTPQNLPVYLEESSIINDLPSSSKIQIYFGENIYSVNGQDVGNEALEDPDLIVKIPSSYLNKEWNSICQLVKTANTNGHLQIDKNADDAELLWKYKSMLKYKDCI